MTRRLSTASNISLVPMSHAVPLSRSSLRSRRCALAISLLACTAAGLGLVVHREVLTCASNCLLAALYPAVKHTLRRTLWLRDLARSMCWVVCCYFVGLAVVNTLSVRHFAVMFSYCHGSERTNCTESTESGFDLLCDGEKVTCPEDFEAAIQLLSAILDFLVLLALLPFTCLFAMAANETLGEEWLPDQWEPTPTANSVVIKGTPEVQDGEEATGFPVEAKRQVETDLTVVAVS